MRSLGRSCAPATTSSRYCAIASVFQTLGLNTLRVQPAIKMFARLLALLIVTGNIAIVFTVWIGFVPEVKKIVGH